MPVTQLARSDPAAQTAIVPNPDKAPTMKAPSTSIGPAAFRVVDLEPAPVESDVEPRGDLETDTDLGIEFDRLAEAPVEAPLQEQRLSGGTTGILPRI